MEKIRGASLLKIVFRTGIGVWEWVLHIARGGAMRRLSFLCLDLANIALATIFAQALRNDLALSSGKLFDVVPYMLATLAVAAVVFLVFGIDRSIWRFTGMRDYLGVLAASVATVIGAVAISFVYDRMDGVARSVPVLQGIVMVWVLIGVRVGIRLFYARAERQAKPVTPRATVAEETVLIVGVSRLAEFYSRCVADLAHKRRRIAGILGDGKEHAERIAFGHPVLGTAEQVSQTVRNLEIHGVFVDRIVVAVDFSELSADAQSALLELERASNIPLDFIVERLGLDAASLEAREADACHSVSPAGALHGSRSADELAGLAGKPYWRVKRLIDALAALALIVLLAPVMGLVAMVVAIDVGLPIMFWQQRPGLGGRPFKLYKFRTMRAAHNAAGHRIPDGKRHSSVGEFLRRSRLDELPQLFHILWGEMSFVGPRPLLPADQAAGFADRLSVRPGLTGWAQVQGGRDISATDKAALDIWYVRNASLALDVQILWRTVPMVIFGERICNQAIDQAWHDLVQAGAVVAQD